MTIVYLPIGFLVTFWKSKDKGNTAVACMFFIGWNWMKAK
jgi:hypothetical protein